jgi:hypothetical protein
MLNVGADDHRPTLHNESGGVDMTTEVASGALMTDSNNWRTPTQRPTRLTFPANSSPRRGGKELVSSSAELAAKINRLFHVMHKRDAPPLTTAAAAAAITAKSGDPISADRLEKLRSGDDDAVPVLDELVAIATHFGVSPRYLTTAEPTPDIDAQLDLLEAMRDTGVRDIRACDPATLKDPEGLRHLADIVRNARQRP